MRDESHSNSRKELMALLLKNQQRVLGFIYTLVPHRADAEDVLQEASLIMWEKFDSFQAGTDFVAWANQIAFFCAKNFRKRQSRGKLLFDDELLNELAETARKMEPEIDHRHDVLQQCLEELNERDRSMILRRYAPQGSVSAAAEVAQRTLTATYKSLSRVRRALGDCVTRKLDTEGADGA